MSAANSDEFIEYNFDLRSDSTVDLPGRLFVPLNYNPAQKYPIVIFFHGKGERGSDNAKHVNNNINNLLAAAKARDFFIYAPQLASSYASWKNERVDDSIRMLSRATREYSIDLERIYVTGLSLGGGGAWSSLARYNHAFAAGVPICGVNPPAPADVATLAGKPVWAFHAANDSQVSVNVTRNNVNAILLAGGETALPSPIQYDSSGRFDLDENNLRYRELSSGNHSIWGAVFNTSEMYDWLLTRVNPFALATLQPGEEMFFDFGNKVHSVDVLGQYWNGTAVNFHDTVETTLPFGVVSGGESTIVSLDVVQPFASHTTNGSTALYETEIGSDGWQTIQNTTAAVRLRGLIPGEFYRLEIYGATSASGRQTRYTANGVQADLNASGNTTDTAVLDNVVASADGSIAITVQAVPGSGSTYGQINTLKLTVAGGEPSIFAQDFAASSVLADYISSAPDSGQFNDISAETDAGTWSITGGRLQLARSGTGTNGAGFTRFSGPVEDAPEVVEVNFKVSLSGVNNYSPISIIRLGDITSVPDYNSSYPSASIGNGLTLKGRGDGYFGFLLDSLAGVYPADGTDVQVRWRVNQSATSQSYIGEDAATHVISSGCSDLWVNDQLILENRPRTYGSSGAKLGGIRMKTSVSQAITTTFDDFVVYDSLPQ